jgi:hypothetical protein
METTIMSEAKKTLEKDLRFQISGLLLAATSILSTLILSSHLMLAQQPKQQVFNSPEEASAALFAAAQHTDNRFLLEILSPAGKEIISSGDPAEDRKNRDTFVAKYAQMHRVARKRDGVMILYVGAENWPFPIPLVEKNSVWYFDTDAGKGEILARRVGRNELATIDVCHQLVDAQERHYARANNGERQYALKFSGNNDVQDDLLSSENGTATSQDPVSFNGYYFRVLTAQGNNAEGGPKSYLVSGKMVSGFAFVAYPAVYRSTGVMTFIVNQNGIVFQKDLGSDTEKHANAITAFDPNSTWERVD